MRTSNHLTASIAALSLMWISTPAKADYLLNLESGELPKDIAVANINGLTPTLSCYKTGHTADGWTVDRVGDKGYCLLSPTHTQSETPCENILSLPEMEIEVGMWLRWEAISLSPDMPESYKVIATPAGGESVTLFETEDEMSGWTTRMVPLARFAGHTVRIQFVCNSVNRYMLAVSGISVKVPTDIDFQTADHTPRFGGRMEPELPKVRVEVTNFGTVASITKVRCTDKKGTVLYGQEDLTSNWDTGKTMKFEFPLDENASEYIVEAVTADGKSVVLTSGRTFISDFARTHLVDKGTGTWCLNCPTAILSLEGLEKKFGESLIAVETHANQELDILANEAYWKGLTFFAAPWFMLNRNTNSAGSSPKYFEKYYNVPTTFKITLDDAKVNGNESATVTAKVISANDIDNSSDRYRIGYVLTASFHDPSDYRLFQKNGINSPSGDRFYFMPSAIPSELMTYHNVSLTSENAFAGVEGSLPTSLKKGESYTCTLTVDRPELLDDLKNGRLVAYVLNSVTGGIENATQILLDGSGSSGIDTVVAGAGTLRVRPARDGSLKLLLPEPGDYRLEAFDISGIRRFATSGTADTTEAVVETGLQPGIYLVRVRTSAETATTRIVVR